MNYSKIYHLLIEKADNRCILPRIYKERHHIIPRCLGGLDNKENIVELLPEEHFVAHQLLVKIYPENYKLTFACNMLTVGSTGVKRNNKQYKWIKIKFSKTQSVIRKKGFADGTLINGFKGKKHSDETRKKISEARKEYYKNNDSCNKGKTLSKQTRDKISESLKGRFVGENNHFYNKKHSEESLKKIRAARKKQKITDETKKKMSAAKIGKKMGPQKRLKCPNCGFEGGISGMKRYHFDNCKSL